MIYTISLQYAFTVADAINSSNNNSAVFNRMKETFNESFEKAKRVYGVYVERGEIGLMPKVELELTKAQHNSFGEIIDDVVETIQYKYSIEYGIDEEAYYNNKEGFDKMVEYFHLEEYAWEFKSWGFRFITRLDDNHNLVYVKKSEATFVDDELLVDEDSDDIIGWAGSHYEYEQLKADNETTIKMNDEGYVTATIKKSAIEQQLHLVGRHSDIVFNIYGWTDNTLFIRFKTDDKADKLMEIMNALYKLESLTYDPNEKTITAKF